MCRCLLAGLQFLWQAAVGSHTPAGRGLRPNWCGITLNKAEQDPATPGQSIGDSQLSIIAACVRTGSGLWLLDPIGGEHCKIAEVHDTVTGDVFCEQRIGLQPCVHEHDQVFAVNDVIVIEVATGTGGR